MGISFRYDLFEHIFGPEFELPSNFSNLFPKEYFKKILSIEQYKRKEKESTLKEHINFFGSGDFFVALAIDAIREKEINIEIGEKVYACKKSIYYKNSNFMFFYEKNSLALIFLPNFFSGSAVFDVRARTLVVINGGHRHLSNQFLAFFEYIYDEADRALHYLSRKESFFSGLLIANSRPYHFFYDILPAVELVAQKIAGGSDKARLIMNPEKSFFNVDELYPGIFDVELLEDDFDCLNFKDSFYVDLAVNKGIVINDGRLRELLDRNVFNVACLNSSLNTFSEQSGYDLNLWFGVTSQKRIWLNQVESIVSLINAVSPHFKNIRVFIDGWTSCIQLSELDRRCIKQDNRVFDQINSRLNKNVQSVNLIGCSSKEKIRFGSDVDVFIVNHSAGSLHVSRFCKKVGISHLNTVMQDDNQIHYNTIRVPDRYIFNKKTLKSAQQGAVALDYYVDFEAISDRFIDLLQIKGFIATSDAEESKKEAVRIYNSMSDVGLHSVSKKTERESLAKPDLLRESALVMEGYNDIHTAYLLMKKAHELRPNGPVIKKKLYEYSSLLLELKGDL